MDPFTSLIDYFIKLVELQNSRKDKYYQEVVKGCYENSRHVKEDLLRIFSESEKSLRDGIPLNSIANSVLQERMVTLSKRDFLRATLEAIDKENYSDFERGIEMLLSGEFYHALKNNARQLMHLHELILCSRKMSDPHQRRYREQQLQEALNVNNRSIEHVNHAWETINSGYAENLKLI